MPPEFNKYYVYDVEVTGSEQKKVLILLQTHNLSDAWWYITTLFDKLIVLITSPYS